MEILKVNNLIKTYEIKKLFSRPTHVFALNDISFSLNKNETLGIVGESGCGKSTLAKVLTKLEEITSGNIELNKKNILDYSNKEYFSKIQMVFQDPYQSLNPRKKAIDIVMAPLLTNSNLKKEEIEKIATDLLLKVGIRPELKNRYPHHFSGGQRQRLGIARALMLRPEILILDEPVSALDVSIQAQVLNLLLELQKEFNLTYIFISHDLSVIKHMSDKILVMYLGRIVEYGKRDDIFSNPLHPYTKLLLESAPKIERNRNQNLKTEANELPTALNLPKGCAFYSRCEKRTERCKENIPLLETKNNRLVACSEI